MKAFLKPGDPPRHQAGFTLLELSVVLVIIGVILGAIAIGSNVQRSAEYQRIATLFVQGWAIDYDTFAANNGIVVGDDPSDPTGRVNAGGGPLCQGNLRSVMLAAGIDMPAGRAAGNETLAVYRGRNGVPQQMAVCFSNVDWAIAGTTPGTWVLRRRNVMSLTGLTPAMAALLDSHFDGRVDARSGDFREQAVAAMTTGASAPWTLDPPLDDAQAPTMSAYLLMNR